nr:sulfatase-like hydrolase/transferase [Motiliproteus sediminis]
MLVAHGTKYPSLLVYWALQEQQRTLLTEEVDYDLELYSLRFGNPAADHSTDELQAILDAASLRPEAPDLVLITLESVGASELLSADGELSAELTPQLAALGKRALLFDQLYVTVSSSEHQNMAMVTGGHQPTYNQPQELTTYRYQGPFLAQQLRQQGYRTGLFSAADLRFRHMDHFFDQAGYQTRYDFSQLSPSSQDILRLNSWGGDDRHFIDSAINWLDQAAQQEPVFLHYLSNAPHHPYSLPQDLTVNDNPGVSEKQRYLRALRFIDAQIGKLVTALKRRERDTIILVTGDHPLARNQLHNDAVRGWLMLYASYSPQPLRSRRVITHADLMPTLLSFGRLPVIPPLPGQNLLSAQFKQRIVYFHDGNQPGHWGLRDGSWLYVANHGIQSPALIHLSKQESVLDDETLKSRMTVYERLLSNWYQRQNQAFLAQLEGFEETGTPMPRQGPTPPVTGHLRQTVPQMPPRFDIAPVFSTRDPIYARSRWIRPRTEQSVEISWLSPSGQQFRQQTQVTPDANLLTMQLPASAPLESGRWTLRVSGDEQQATTTFEVSYTQPSANAGILNFLQSVRVGYLALKTEEFLGYNRLSDQHRFTIETRWHRLDRERLFTLVLVSPSLQAHAFDARLAPGWNTYYKQLTPPNTLEHGRWRVEVWEHGQYLGSVDFDVAAQPPTDEGQP